MHPGLITCRPDATLGQVAVMLTQHRVHALFVTDRDNRPVGVVTDFDLLAGEWLSADAQSLAAMRTMTAGELMTAPIDSVEAEVPVGKAAQRIREGGYYRLLVTDKGKPVGVISVSDFVASLTPPIAERETVDDVMSRVMLVCREDTPCSAVARGMTDARYRSVLVVNKMGRLQGIVSGLDLLTYCEEGGCGDNIAGRVMHPALTIYPTVSLREAADMMIDNHHHRLVVTDPDQPDAMPLGIISSVDIVAMMAQPGSVWQR
jgi:CBS domain-containing protein